MKITSMIVSGLVLLVTLALALPAQAVLVKGAAGQVFFDDYETQAPGSASVALIGAWSGAPTVRDNTTAPPFSDDQFGQREISAVIATFAQQNSGIVTLSTMIQVPSNSPESSFEFLIELRDNSGSVVYTISRQASGVVRDATNGVNFAVPTIDRGNWYQLDVEYQLGSNQLTVGVDGTFDTQAIGNSISNAVDVQFRRNGNATYYLDNVPEPATMGLMALGALALLRRRY